MGHRLSQLAAYMGSIGLRMPHARPDKFLAGPFYFPTVLTAGVLNFDFQTGANLTDPGLCKEFVGSETSTPANSPNLIFHVERLSIIVGDMGELLSSAQALELGRKSYFQTVIKSQNRTYTIGRNIASVGNSVASTVGAAERRSLTNELRAFSRPIEFDLRSDSAKVLTQTAITGTPTVNCVLVVEGAVWDPNQFENATLLDSAAWDGKASGIDNLRARMAGASHFKGLTARGH